MAEMMKDKDQNKLARVTEAFLKIKKFDIAALQRAYEGGWHEKNCCSARLYGMSCTMKDGQKTDFRVRRTACFRRIKGKWLITHEYVFVPVDFESAKALLDLKPSSQNQF